jgi:hypothetical protein
MGYAGIVYQDIDRTCAGNFSENVFDLLLVGNVTETPAGPSSGGTNLTRGLFGIALIDFNDVD